MNTIQNLMNDRILREIEDLREEQTKLQRVITTLAELVRDMSNKGCYEKKINNIIYSIPYDLGYLMQYYVFLLVWVDCSGIV